LLAKWVARGPRVIILTLMTTPKATATVKRPNGQIETVDVTAAWAKLHQHSEAELLSYLKSATAKAGRGEVLSVECEKQVYTKMATADAVDAICDHQDRMARVMRAQG